MTTNTQIIKEFEKNFPELMEDELKPFKIFLIMALEQKDKEFLELIPKRKSEQKYRKDQDEWINIPRIQRAVGFNSCLQQITNLIKEL